MDIKTAFSNGDKIWVCWPGKPDGPSQLTVGRVQVTVTESPGREGEEIFDNYKPQSEYHERYMCVETGIGSGSVYTLGEHAFATQEEAIAAMEKARDMEVIK